MTSRFLPQRRPWTFVAFVLVAGLAWVRALARDRWICSEVVFCVPFFAFPVALLMLSCVVRVSRRVALGLFLGSVPVLVGPLVCEQPRLLTAAPVHNSPSQTELKITCWNVMSFNRGQDLVVEEYRSEDADIVCLIEGTYRKRPPDFLERGLGKDYQWVATSQLAIGSRLPILDSGELPCATRLRLFKTRVKTPAGPLAVLLVDVPGPPRLDTGEIFNELWATLQTIEEPFVVVGDFNTPRGSWHLARATAGLTDPHRKASARGWLGSWPSVLPVYQLDHCFLSPGIAALESHLVATRASDHCRQSVRFVVDPVTGGGRSSRRHEVETVP